MTALEDNFQRIMVALEWISKGYTKTYACDQCGVSTTLFNKYVSDHPMLADLANEATERGYDALADALVTINTSAHGVSDPKMAAIISKNIQWFLARRRPKEYGDRVTIEHNITADKVILNALARGQSRAFDKPAVAPVRMIDVTPTRQIVAAPVKSGDDDFSEFA